MTIFSVALTLFLVMNPPFGAQQCARILAPLPEQLRMWIVIREALLALLLMLVFYRFGEGLLLLLNVSMASLQISGGVMTFLIALQLIFPSMASFLEEDEIGVMVPVATPMIAGPAVLATISVYSRLDAHDTVLMGLCLAWAAMIPLLVLAALRPPLLMRRGFEATQRLIGLLLTLMATQQILNGIKSFVSEF